nr:Uma2 family endonuclease [Nocardioides speluncae]
MPVDESHHIECSEGVLSVTPKPFPRHQLAMTNLVYLIRKHLPPDLIALPEVDVLITESPLTVRAPDVVVTTKAAVEANPPRLAVADIRLAVEIVSEGSRRTDRVTKRSEYAEAGIPDYWIIDLADPVTLTSFHLDRLSYRTAEEHKGVSSLTACGVVFNLDLGALTAL